jgi:isopentenyl diphosphate isomerase/L-lactate dehydrogenase-like FMN-dependent dehydrogenase
LDVGGTGNIKFTDFGRRVGRIEVAVGAEEFEYADAVVPLGRQRAYEAVQAVVSDDNNFERGVEGARAVADAVLAEAGAVGLAETVVELALKLGEALERIASEQGLAAADLAEVWFVE